VNARAGDVVHVGIWGVDGWGVAYHLELGGNDLLDGRSSDYVNTTFTMPDLGENARTVSLDTTLWWGETRTHAQQAVEYRGPALPADPPAPSAGSTAPASTPLAAPSPQHGRSPAPVAGNSPSHSAIPKSQRRPGHAHHRDTADSQRHATAKAKRRADGHRRDRHKRRTAAKHRRSARPAGHTEPFLSGFAGPAESASDPAGSKGAGRPRVTFTARSALDSMSAALAIPGALTAAALTLVGLALLRRRRLLRAEATD